MPNYLKATSLIENTKIWFDTDQEEFNKDIWYSFDQENWQQYTQKKYNIKLSLNQSVYFKGINSTFVGCYFTGDGEISLNGSIMSLIDGVGESLEIPERSCFESFMYRKDYLFIITPPELPATILKPFCYDNLFYCQEKLQFAPELPATQLAEACYQSIFSNTGIEEAPELPATELDEWCYSTMFYECQNLTIPPELPAMKLKSHCYNSMFSRSGIEEAPELPATELDKYCYSHMFNGCRNLTIPPELPAMELKPYCYYFMFSSTNMEKFPNLQANELIENCYYGMFYNATIKDFIKLPATKLADYCYSDMFNGAQIKYIPELPATQLAVGCYNNMFSNSNISIAPELPATELAVFCYANMFNGCKNLTIPPELPATLLADQCYWRMFSSSGIKILPKLHATILEYACYYGMFADNDIKISEIQTQECPYPYSFPYNQDGKENVAEALKNIFSFNYEELEMNKIYYLSIPSEQNLTYLDFKDTSFNIKDNNIMLVNLYYNEDNIISNISFEKIIAASNFGKIIVARLQDDFFVLNEIDRYTAKFSKINFKNKENTYISELSTIYLTNDNEKQQGWIDTIAVRNMREDELENIWNSVEANE